MGYTQTEIGKEIQVAGTYLFEGAHGTGAVPVDTAEINSGCGVTEDGIVHRREIEDIKATVPLQPYP